jgi:Tfp pilus assembly protein PilV
MRRANETVVAPVRQRGRGTATQRRGHRRGFALYEVLLGVTIFVVGALALGRSMENCLNASTLSEDDARVRLILANRMAEIQATPGFPDESKQTKIDTGFGQVTVTQKVVPAGLKDEKDVELTGISTVTLMAQWTRGGGQQSRRLEFYVYRAG